MDFNNKKELIRNGFKGFVSVNSLRYDKSVIPKERGVYLVINPDFESPKFINPGVGGFFKGRNPNVSLDELSSNYVANAQIVYIGKGGGASSKATLNSRIGQYLRFGEGKNVGHWGGRLIWQLKNHSDLIFCWKPTPDEEPREVEKELIDLFAGQFGKLPLANLVR